MGETSNSRLAWFVRGSKWFWEQRAFIWIAIILQIVLGVFVTWLFTDPTTVPKLPINWVYQNPLIVLIAFLVLFFLTVLSAIVRFLPVDDMEQALRRRYLAPLGQKCERLSFDGGPVGLIEARIKIEDVFIPLRLRPIPRLDTQGVSDEELAHAGRQYEQRLQLQERARFLKEAQYERNFKQLDTIEFADLWEQLTRENPVAVIQGYPGMGKSTLLMRLTLYMTRRRMGKTDSAMPDLTPALLPILVSLKEFAHKIETDEHEKATHSLLNFIQYAVEKDFHIPARLLEKWLNDCSCLVLLDGLDEVSSEQTRQIVQKAIRDFVDEQSHAEKRLPTYNRFLITSRVAGYDREAFPHYVHYLLAELTVKQIESFLPRWCRANMRRDLRDVPDEVIENEAREVEQKLLRAINNNRGLRVLAENPFLLTLLAAMQQRGTELPSSRAELYKEVTITLLKRRNEAKGILPLPEAEAIQRLGPLAYKMHGEENSFAREQDVLAAIEDAIRSPQGGGGSQEVVKVEARDYLERVGRRGGLFVKRTGDFYGFFHRTFEEYFAALHILKRIESERDTEIKAFIALVRQRDDLWREPYLLAVALKSREDSTVATQLIRELFQTPQNAKDPLHDLLLATTAIIESETEAIDRTLQQEIAAKLIQTYEQAQRGKRFKECDEIEEVVSGWLLSLSKEAYKPPVLQALEIAIRDVAQPALQCAVLALLIMIGQQLTKGSSAIFSQLVPPMLALAGLPAVGQFQPASGLSVSTNIDVVGLAFTALSFMNERGPAGALLVEVRQHFKDHPEQLELLARYSLENGTLITPVVPPLSGHDYQRYESAIKRWIPLRDRYKKAHPMAERDINACLEIHNTLLDCAREARYPTATLLLDLLNTGVNASTPWQQAWQTHLLAQLDTGDYLNYQQTTLFWVMLFPHKQEMQILTNHILMHYSGTEITVRRNAECFISSLITHLGYLGYLRGLRGLRDLGYLRDLRDLIYSRSLIYLMYLIYLRGFGDLGELMYLGDLRDLREKLLTREVAEQARKSILSSDLVRAVNMLKILLGRIIQIKDSGAIDNNTKKEVQDIIISAKDGHAMQSDDEVKQAALDVLRYLPVRSADEIRVVIQLAESATDGDLRQAYASSLRSARPGKDDADAWKELEVGRKSHVDEMREAVKSVFEQAKRK